MSILKKEPCSLSCGTRLGGALQRLTKRYSLSDSDVNALIEEYEAHVAESPDLLKAWKDFQSHWGDYQESSDLNQIRSLEGDMPRCKCPQERFLPMSTTH